jgi:hypothetical protein
MPSFFALLKQRNFEYLKFYFNYIVTTKHGEWLSKIYTGYYDYYLTCFCFVSLALETFSARMKGIRLCMYLTQWECCGHILYIQHSTTVIPRICTTQNVEIFDGGRF